MERRKAYVKFVNKVGKCELCGNTRNLQLHHIVPLCVQDRLPFINLDVEDNYLVVCQKCHTLLTPRNLLTKIGLNKSKHEVERYRAFYEEINEYDGHISTEECLDVFDKYFFNRNG